MCFMEFSWIYSHDKTYRATCNILKPVELHGVS